MFTVLRCFWGLFESHRELQGEAPSARISGKLEGGTHQQLVGDLEVEDVVHLVPAFGQHAVQLLRLTHVAENRRCVSVQRHVVWGSKLMPGAAEATQVLQSKSSYWGRGAGATRSMDIAVGLSHLRDRAREAVEDETGAALRRRDVVLDEAHHDVIRHQRPRIHCLLRL